jgi:hypothetical protein
VVKVCKHRNRAESLDDEPASWIRCIDCHSYLSLGPANDTPETLVEIRATEIAEHAGPWNIRDNPHEWDDTQGWEYHFNGLDPCVRHDAGWLAREIWVTP